ncbi:hypothetical protein CHA01nite_32270 [Chryseobacterium hagamense]|uniref:Uncharacterized protein n=2 Tax=Chryseobacterium hagamense TaxID=395935 RepID=A0A511YQL1_9FLAO|nr:hypothetical protein CHA01nite_32270 [Chryseobacterium hagamense]
MIALVLFNFIFVSCNRDELLNDSIKSDTPVSQSNMQRMAAYSDVDVFKGIMFLEGPVADRLEDFQEISFRNFANNQTEINEMINFETLIIAQINHNNPDFMSEFREGIGSGDYYTVQNTMLSAVKEIKNSTAELSNLNQAQIDKIQNDVSTILKDQGINTLTKQNISTLVNKLTNKQKPQGQSVVDIYKWVYAAVAVVVAAVLVAFAFFVAPPDMPGNFPTIDNTYYSERFQTTVTVDLQGI